MNNWRVNENDVELFYLFQTEWDIKAGVPKADLQEETIDWMKSLGLNYKTITEVIRPGSGLCPVVYKAIEEGITRANLHATSRAHKVQKFILLDRDFSCANGELSEWSDYLDN